MNAPINSISINGRRDPWHLQIIESSYAPVEARAIIISYEDRVLIVFAE